MGTNINYDDADHEQIYNDIHGGMKSEPLQAISDEWRTLSRDVGVRAKSYIEQTLGGITASREGAAADAATASTAAFLPWMEELALIAENVATRVQNQAHYWVKAKDSVPEPVPPEHPLPGWGTERLAWFPALSIEEMQAAQRRQEAAEQARQAMRVYQASTNANMDPAPVFPRPPVLNGHVGEPPLATPRVDNHGAAPPAAPAAAPPAVAGSGSPGTESATDQPVGTEAQLAPAPPQPRGPGSPGSGGSPGSPAPAHSTPGDPIPLAARYTGTSARAGRTDLVRPGSLGGSAASPGAGGAGPGYRASGYHASGYHASGSGYRAAEPGSGPARSGRGGADPGFGPRSGAGPAGPPGIGGQAAADTGGGGARGEAGPARGVGGTGLGVPLTPGTGHGSGGEDREHSRKYLIESAPNAITGELPPTAPSVISPDPDD